ncbi:3-hydroxyacyl-CoA dehydrogenase family protein [Haladaptatus sp. DFWS20]|uniref:3-hydroxyacyl-CoA dehydrogenase family protein n=1 Tax=Haladaptatus sp. DFWS20 TaxID=3403467 RepID=UPI003EBD89F4
MALKDSGEEAEIARVTVVGAGTMGYGIGLAFALGRKHVTLFDVDESALHSAAESISESIQTLQEHGQISKSEVNAIEDHIEYESSLETAVQHADLVTEAVPEKMELKKTVLEEIDQYTPEDAIIASNTSGLPITELATAVEKPSLFIGTHHFNPAYIVPVVELIKGDQTVDSIVNDLYSAFESMDKVPVIVNNDIPGFIVNRIQTAMAYEAESLVNRGIASAADIDRAVKGSLGFRLPAIGIFEKSDHSGLDVHHEVITNLLPELDRGTEPHDFLTELVEEGEYGVKSGKGVYNWSEQDMEAVYAERDGQLLSQLSIYREGLSR